MGRSGAQDRRSVTSIISAGGKLTAGRSSKKTQIDAACLWHRADVCGGIAATAVDCHPETLRELGRWRPRPESNRGARICSPLRNHSATRPSPAGAGEALPIASGCAPRNTCFASSDLKLSFPLEMAKQERWLAKQIRACYMPTFLIYARPYSLIAQLVEQSTVNRSVAGSSPAQGATPKICTIRRSERRFCN
jgi:hypothetical protein